MQDMMVTKLIAYIVPKDIQLHQPLGIHLQPTVQVRYWKCFTITTMVVSTNSYHPIIHIFLLITLHHITPTKARGTILSTSTLHQQRPRELFFQHLHYTILHQQNPGELFFQHLHYTILHQQKATGTIPFNIYFDKPSSTC